MGHFVAGRLGRSPVSRPTTRGTTTYNPKTRSYSGPGAKPKGAKIRHSPTTVVTTSPAGRIITSGFSSPHAAQVARKHTRSSRARVGRIERQQASALGFHRRTQQRASLATPRTPEAHARLASLGVASPKVVGSPPRETRAPSYKPPKFQGAKTAGTPSLKELQVADKQGTIRRNKAGYVTTPAIRRVSSSLKQAKKVVARSQPSLKGLAPAERSVVPLVRKAHRKYPDIPKSVMMAQIKQESGFNPAAISSAEAQGLTQFIPSTAASYGVKYGTGRREQQSQVTGQAKLLHSDNFASDPQGALSAYSGGYAAGDYNNPILEDAKASYGALDKPGNPKALKRLAATKRKALNLGLAAGKQASAKKVVTVPGKGRYVFPFPENKGWSWSRTDMGTDFAYSKEGAPIRALGSGVVTKTGAPGWPGEGGVLLKLDHAKGLPSPYVFVYEGVVPTVSAGQRVKRGQLLARGGITGSIEIGFADSSGQALAASEYTEGMVTKYGQASTNLLHMVESGKTRIPVSLLSVGGTLMPNSGGTVVGPSGTAEATLAPTHGGKGKSAQKQRPRLTQAQKAHRTLKKLEQVGAGLSEKPSEGSESKASILKELEARYGSKAA